MNENLSPPKYVPTPCPLCGSEESSLFDQRNFRGQEITNRICTTCGLIYLSPRMSDADLENYYQSEYRLMYQGSEGPNVKDLATQKGRADSLVDFMEACTCKVLRHLDIGCSAGIFLKRLMESYQTQAVGIEPGETYRRLAQDAGLTVYSSLSALMAAGEPPFDLVSLAHVLEHLGDPAAYLSSLREKLLTPEGHLLIEVPNLYAHDCFEVAHLVSFSAHTLSQMVMKAGFEVLVLEEHGRPRSEILPLYLTLLARPNRLPSLSYQMKAESHVSWKRRMGMSRRRLLTRLYPRKAWIPIQ